MKNVIRIVIALMAGVASLLAQQKLAQTGMKFLSVGTDTRISAIGGGATATEGFASSVFYNPASMARIPGQVDVVIGTTLWIADITHGYGSIAIRPGTGDLGVFALSFQTVDYGDLFGTEVEGSSGFRETGIFSPTAYAIGFGYAVALNEKLSIGGHARYVQQSIGSFFRKANEPKIDFTAEVAAFDLGVLYKTGYKSLNFGMSIRNFSKEIRYLEENFQLPLTFRVGLSMNMLDLFDVERTSQAFMLTVDADHPRDFPEQVRVGGEYTFFDMLSLRAGYVSESSEKGTSFGVGFSKKDEGEILNSVGVDYAYTPFSVFSSVHRFSFHVAF